MTATEFLKEKNILTKERTKWIARFKDGREINVVDLMEEYAQAKSADIFNSGHPGKILQDFLGGNP